MEELTMFEAGIAYAKRWIPVEESKPPFSTFDAHNTVLVRYTTILGETRECTAQLHLVAQHNFDNSPYHARWYVYPSGGHKLETVTHWRHI